MIRRVSRRSPIVALAAAAVVTLGAVSVGLGSLPSAQAEIECGSVTLLAGTEAVVAVEVNSPEIAYLSIQSVSGDLEASILPPGAHEPGPWRNLVLIAAPVDATRGGAVVVAENTAAGTIDTCAIEAIVVPTTTTTPPPPTTTTTAPPPTTTSTTTPPPTTTTTAPPPPTTTTTVSPTTTSTTVPATTTTTEPPPTTTTSQAPREPEGTPPVTFPPRTEPDIAFPPLGSYGDTATPIKHFITLMQENHSFDNYFGTYPGVDGLPEGTCVPWEPDDPSAGCAEPFPIGTRQIVDLGHNEVVFARQYNDGRMDGFLKAYENQLDVTDLPLGYYDDNDLPFYWNIADNYVLMDRFFTSAKAGSVPNHFFWATGDSGDMDNPIRQEEGVDCATCSPIPTIFDRLQEAGIDWKFYVQNYDPAITFRNKVAGDRGAQIVWVPLLNYNRFLDDPELSSRIVPFDEYFEDLENGTLPAVSYMVPSGASEHPPGSIQAGERFVRTIITSLQRSEFWESSAFTWTYDDWGGWYDHVEPPQVDEWGYGFRAPSLLVSPYAKPGYVESTEMDFTSILKFIELNWGLEPLAERDRVADTFINSFDFDQPPREPVFLDRVRDPIPPDVPKRGVVYASYSLALAIPLVLSLLGALVARRARRSTRES